MSPTSADGAVPAGAEEHAEVVVIGAGPAGMAAAVHASAAGCAVTVLDTYPAPGGQYHRGPALGLNASAGRPRAAPAPPVAAFRGLVDAGRVRLRSATTVWTAGVDGGAAAPFLLHLTGVGAPLEGAPAVRTRAVVLATGALDRVLPFPGWDLPGVFTAGGAQALLKGQGVLVGRRAVVGGSGPFLLPVAAALAAAGCDVAEVVEASGLGRLPRQAALGWTHRDKVAEAAGYLRTLARHRVPIRPRSAVTAAAGDGRVEEVTISRVGADWSPVRGTERRIAVDAACVSFGFVPQIGLAALLGCRIGRDPLWGDAAVACDGRQETAVPGVFAAGEVTGVTGSDGAAAEGAVAGLAAAAALGHLDPVGFRSGAAPLSRERDRQRRFAAALATLYRPGDGWPEWLTEDTTICRCEEVPYRVLRAAIEQLGASDLRSLKMTSRCGMGYCQGRMCGDAVAAILARATGGAVPDAGALSTPPVLTPVPLGRVAELARDDGPPPGGTVPRDESPRPSPT